MEILDERPISDNYAQSVVYAGFWIRLGALFMDGLVLSPVLAAGYFNLLQWKSIPLLIIFTFIQIGYSPFFEYHYGATLGKMALRLKVVNSAYQKINSTEALMRNI